MFEITSIDAGFGEKGWVRQKIFLLIVGITGFY